MKSNERFWDLLNIERSLGSSPNDSLYNIIRIIYLKDRLVNEYPNNPYELFNILRTLNINIPAFNGDERLFFALFERMSELSDEDLIKYARTILDLNKYPFVPDHLASLMFKNKEIIHKEILVCEVEKFGAELYEFVRNTDAKFYFTIKDALLKMLFMALYRNVEVEFINSEIYEDGFTTKKFDLIICMPVMGCRLLTDKRNDFISREMSFVATQNLLYHLTSNGKLAIVLPAKIGFGGGDAAILRNYIQYNYKINEIASLPTKLFYPFMAISTYFLSFSNGVTEDVCVKKYELNNDGLYESDNRLIFNDELENLNVWNVDMMFAFTDESLLSYQASSVKKAQLNQIADVFRGKAITDKAEDGNVSIINISNITETGIDYNSLDTVFEEQRKVSRYLLEDGDVLIATKGYSVKVAVYEKQNKMCIASSNLCVVRPNQRFINGIYLKLFLESEVGMKLLKSLQRGTTIVNINYQDICQLEIPTPPIEEQLNIANEYEAGLKLYKETIKAAEDAWNKIKNSVKTKLF